jgi:uncharacterized protein
VERILHYPRIQERYNLPEEKIQIFLQHLRAAELVEPERELQVVDADQTDNRYLECAYFGDAKYLISGDKHLLVLQQYEHVVILNPASFFSLVQSGAA